MYENTTGKAYELNELNMGSKKIENTGAGTVGTDVMVLSQRYTDAEAGTVADGKITTHTAISAAHHARPIQATEAIVGIAEIATQVETDAGTDDQRIVTPLKLASYSGLGIASGTSFPGTPSDGDLFNRTDLDMIFRYDGTRTKWLSEKTMTVILSRDAGLAGMNVYFLVGDVPTSSTNGYPIIEDMTIVSAGFRNANSLTRDIHIQINGVNQQTLSLVAASIIKKTDINVDVDADKYISPILINGTGTLANGFIVLSLKWRA